MTRVMGTCYRFRNILTRHTWVARLNKSRRLVSTTTQIIQLAQLAGKSTGTIPTVSSVAIRRNGSQLKLTTMLCLVTIWGTPCPLSLFGSLSWPIKPYCLFYGKSIQTIKTCCHLSYMIRGKSMDLTIY